MWKVLVSQITPIEWANKISGTRLFFRSMPVKMTPIRMGKLGIVKSLLPSSSPLGRKRQQIRYVQSG